jgi:DNA-binding NtrC family response regulator
LQDQEFRRVGGTEVVRVDVRVIAATHRDLVQAIKDRTFREDLYFRLNIVSLALPALRERKEDILSLAQFFISRHGTSDSQAVVLTPALEAALVAFRWPGNVRQLENVMRKMIVLRDPDVIVRELGTIDGKGINGDAADASDMLVSDRKKLNFEPSSVLQQASRAKQEAEAEAILQALHSSRWNRKQAAAMLQIEYKTLLYKMKKLEIEERASKISLTA